MTTKKNAAGSAVQAEPCQEERRMLALQCTRDISAIAQAVTLMADEVDGDVKFEGLLRCFGTRIFALNGMLMAYLDEDGTTAKEMHQKIFGLAIPYEGGAA
ncbi:hypothetical protein G7047_17240 [Diaphorobacter sp. HDW4A]|uniref:hypothetical protein n=1 Tax=Diaphorobacter sp. HDW4A TaxID=2714924 RepID=UPI0014087DBC|nr:hypothetical protein [Diaphorobacter sp. HDW4A]QIL78587.1 hypothetical protein G7047_00620 [Diaphorobacter sp. HDW4A]QIL81461.1 hypothetical protein G7047_17240 [Diaphorobacter sp. HDW4A]